MGKKKCFSFIDESIAEAKKPVKGLVGKTGRGKSRRKKKKR